MTTIITPPEWAALGGSWSLQVAGHGFRDYFVRNMVAVVVEHDLKGYRRAGWVPFNARAFADIDPALVLAVVFGRLDHVFRPWLTFAAIPWPSFEPFPRLARLAAWWRS